MKDYIKIYKKLLKLNNKKLAGLKKMGKRPYNIPPKEVNRRK